MSHISRIKCEGLKSAAKVREGGHIWTVNCKKSGLALWVDRLIG
jgi:hypothetical protein